MFLRVAIGKLPCLSVYGDDFPHSGRNRRTRLHPCRRPGSGTPQAIDYSPCAHRRGGNQPGHRQRHQRFADCTRLRKKPAAMPSLIKLWKDAPATSLPATQMPPKHMRCSAGKQPAPSTRCARVAGTLSPKIQTDWNNHSSGAAPCKTMFSAEARGSSLCLSFFLSFRRCPTLRAHIRKPLSARHSRKKGC